MDNIKFLIEKLLSGEITPEQRKELDAWLDSSGNEDWLLQYTRDNKELKELFDDLHQFREEGALERFQKKHPFPIKVREEKRTTTHWWKLALAGCLVVIAFSVWWMVDKKSDVSVVKKQENIRRSDSVSTKEDVLLTLGDGTTIILDSFQKGVVAQQDNIQVIQGKDGQLRYDSISEKARTIPSSLFHEISIPKGRWYNIVLPDGSKVFLNSDSWIRYAATPNAERIVELKGEAYFEVRPLIRGGKQASFTVIVRNKKNEEQSRIEVLGTHFNIKAYDDEPVQKTTLLEGSVKVSNPIGTKVLIPGQQAQIIPKGQVKTAFVDTVAEVSWRSGLVVFKDENLETVLRLVSRWHDVEIVYQGQNFYKELNIGINKKWSLAAIVGLLNQVGDTRFSIEGKRLLVDNTRR